MWVCGLKSSVNIPLNPDFSHSAAVHDEVLTDLEDECVMC